MPASISRSLLFLCLAAALCSSCIGCVFVNREQIKPKVFHYIGCFEDRPHSRDLPIPGGHGYHMDTNQCNVECKKSRTKFMGLQDGGYCWCGNKFNKYGKKEDKVCDVPCLGNPKEKCGFKDHNSVYETSY